MPYEVQTPVFEGPFDLLLHLITKEQVDVYEVPLLRIVDAFLAELERIQADGRLNLDGATEFLLIAATLVELKSRRLLPGIDDGELEEELALWEERDLLLSRLLECKTFKDAAGALMALAGEAEKSYPRTSGMEEQFLSLTPDMLSGVTPEKLRKAFLKAVMPKAEPKVDLYHVAQVKVSVQDALEELIDELPRIKKISFRHLTADLVERLEVIVRFLAVLELFKQGLVEIDQPERFGDLEITWTGEPDVVIDLVHAESYEG